VDNLTGTPVHATPGTNFTFGGSNADGTAVTLLSALSRDIEYLVLGLGGCDTTNEDNSALVDLLKDPAGGTSWADAASNLAAGFTVTPGAQVGLMTWYHFPLWLKAGTSIGLQARKAGATAATTGRCAIWAFGAPKNPHQWWCGQKIESIGINEASSKGTAHTPGNTGSYSTPAAIGSTTKRWGAMQLGLNGSDSSMLAVSYYWQICIAGAKLPGTPTYAQSCSASEASARSGFPGVVHCDIPAGTEVQVRGTCSGTAEAP
jgi:hypothetical protein